MALETSGWAMGVVMCHCPGKVIIVGSPLVLGPLADDVLGVVTSGWALCILSLWLKAPSDSENGVFGLVTHLPT